MTAVYLTKQMTSRWNITAFLDGCSTHQNRISRSNLTTFHTCCLSQQTDEPDGIFQHSMMAIRSRSNITAFYTCRFPLPPPPTYTKLNCIYLWSYSHIIEISIAILSSECNGISLFLQKGFLCGRFGVSIPGEVKPKMCACLLLRI